MEGVGLPPGKTHCGTENVPQKVKSTKKWKRSARGGQGQQILGKLSSPLNKMLSLSQKNRKNTKQNSISPKQRSPSSKVSPKTGNRALPSPLSSLSNTGRQTTEMKELKSKRKVEFPVEEKIKENKKSGCYVDEEKIEV
ncbi:hypothetical protein Q3G72_033318 [Acer saccharum]|nr:hypothetical protein Q3G72_033318 [Acer saccharum]